MTTPLCKVPLYKPDTARNYADFLAFPHVCLFLGVVGQIRSKSDQRGYTRFRRPAKQKTTAKALKMSKKKHCRNFNQQNNTKSFSFNIPDIFYFGYRNKSKERCKRT